MQQREAFAVGDHSELIAEVREVVGIPEVEFAIFPPDDHILHAGDLLFYAIDLTLCWNPRFGKPCVGEVAVGRELRNPAVGHDKRFFAVGSAEDLLPLGELF